MKKGNLILLVIVGLLALVGFNGCNTYNQFVEFNENAEKAWANVQTQYQRRLDLIGNLVKTVQGAADFERSTLTEITEARARVGSIQLNANELTEEKLAEFQAAQDQMRSALSRLLVVVERYPELKANQNFLELQAQLEGTENRIATARRDFNDVVAVYNKAVKRFPGRFWASVFGFEPKAMFKSEAGAEKAPEVQFDFK
ncbi:LemA family protein [Schleiferia thermophila]|uniref:LemA family protein n=1 Tax=Schleiferia thermophila TaxID=884107 RepID=UPI0004E7B688|nr:LemA family protein [Schleiferia thermophila]KFD39508.1 LemA family protein [Schleiferia thermophila str. Yellowstone]PMB33152.1 LemA family protein [Fischerella thermalis CCMEE 5319]